MFFNSFIRSKTVFLALIFSSIAFTSAGDASAQLVTPIVPGLTCAAGLAWKAAICNSTSKWDPVPYYTAQQWCLKNCPSAGGLGSHAQVACTANLANDLVKDCNKADEMVACLCGITSACPPWGPRIDDDPRCP